MNPIFKYNSNAKYSTKHLKGGHNTDDFSLLDVYLIVMVEYKPELNEYFHMYRCQLNFAMFCATSALGFACTQCL